MFFETLIITILGTALSYQDISQRKVNTYILSIYVLAIIVFYRFENICILPSIIFLAIGIVYYVVKKKQAFGFADYILILVHSLLIKNSMWELFIICIGIYGIIFGVIFRKYQNIPFIPVIFLATITINFIKHIFTWN
ncbi:MAG: hypothetical protein LBI26_00025 [Holosporales bacterium]|jgi:hypothetical protein|nr:hypothetical protein [Holosporales bacterium]